MANTEIAYQEMRFDVRDPELTQVYIMIDNLSNDGLIGVQGWHHKTFPARMSVIDIMKAWQDGDDPLLWSQQAPPE